MKNSNPPQGPLDFLSEQALHALTEVVKEKVLESIEKSSTSPASQKSSDPDFLTTEEAADKLRTTSATIRKLCREGKLKFLRAGRAMLITQEHINQYVKTLQNHPHE